MNEESNEQVEVPAEEIATPFKSTKYIPENTLDLNLPTVKRVTEEEVRKEFYKDRYEKKLKIDDYPKKLVEE